MTPNTPAMGDRAGGLWASHTAGAQHHPSTLLRGSTVQDRNGSKPLAGGRLRFFTGAT